MHDVFGAYLTDGREVSHSFMVSMMRLDRHDRANDRRLLDAGMTHARVASGGIAGGRNDLTRHFLASDATWLWMVDSDMGFAPDTLDRLLASLSGHPGASYAVGALCFSWRPEEPDGMGGYRFRPRPTIFGWDGVGFRAVDHYTPNAVIKVGGTGAACLLIHRTVMEAIESAYAEEWWTPVRYPNGDFLSEDLSFCYRAGQQGYPIFVDTSIKTTHAKTLYVSEEHWATWNERGFGALQPSPREQMGASGG